MYHKEKYLGIHLPYTPTLRKYFFFLKFFPPSFQVNLSKKRDFIFNKKKGKPETLRKKKEKTVF